MSHQRPRKTPIFDTLSQRYTSAGGWVSETEEQWALGAYMRGFTYMLVLQDVLDSRPKPTPRRLQPIQSEFNPTVWDAIDAVPNRHSPTL